MLVKTLQNQIFNVVFEDLYIKPFYKGDIIDHYSICTNERNKEIELGSYTDKNIAEHMLHLTGLYKDYPNPIEMLKEISLCQDMYLTSLYKLRKAQRGTSNETIYRK